jgi:predicted Zn-dependent protease
MNLKYAKSGKWNQCCESRQKELFVIERDQTMKPLEPPDTHHLNAALGWFELGDHLEANQELENITPALRSHPLVLELRWQIYAKEKKWEACVDIASALVKANPEQPANWINKAYSLRRAESSGLVPAQEVLLKAHTLFPLEVLIQYNLACYDCQLENLEEARNWLKKAFDIGDSAALKLMALEDPDLERLWEEVR